MLFSAEITDFRIVHNVLKAISFREFAKVRPMEEGLKFALEETQCVETLAYVPRNMFCSYHVDTTQDVLFKISMKVFTECLNIFGDDGNSSLKLSYKEVGAPLCLVMNHAEENITADSEIRTMNVDDSVDVSLADECNLNKIVINASILAEILQRLDNAADEIQISISPDPPYFTLISTGVAGDSEVNISKHSDSTTVFECKSKTTSTYAFVNIRQVLKVMNFANKVAISTGESGLLGLQLVITSEDKQMYVEYYVTSQFANE